MTDATIAQRRVSGSDVRVIPETVELLIRIPGDIRGKGRPRFARTKTGVRTFTDDATARAETWVRACALNQIGRPIIEGALAMSVAITVAIPRSWSKRKQSQALDGSIHPTGKPDVSNSAKLCEDSLNGIAFRDDSQIVDLHVSKRYGLEPGAVLRISRA